MNSPRKLRSGIYSKTLFNFFILGREKNALGIMSLSTQIETPSVSYEQPTGLYIDGKFVKGKEGKTFETINPTNEKPIVAVHEAGAEGELSSLSLESS